MGILKFGIGGVVAMCMAAGLAAPAGAQSNYPEKPIRVIVPYPAGVGLTSSTANTFSAAAADGEAISQPLQVINIPGAGGSIGAREAQAAEPDGYTILGFNESLAASKALGLIDFGHDAFEPVASVGEWCGMVLVPQSSPYETFADLLNAIKEKPNTVTAAVALGTTSHFSTLIFNDTLGIEPRLVAAGSPAERMPQLAGGHVDFTLSSVNSYLQFKPLGVRALAMLAPERHPDADDIPTAREQGIDAPDYCGTIYFLAPKNTPAAAIETLQASFGKILEHPVAVNGFKQAGMTPKLVTGDAFRQQLQAVEDQFEEVVENHPELRQ